MTTMMRGRCDRRRKHFSAPTEPLPSPAPGCPDLLWWNRSSSHCQAGNLLMAGSLPTRGGSSSNASAGLASSTRPAELIALSSSVLDGNSLELNEARWCRDEEAALTQLMLPTLHRLLGVKCNFHHHWS